MKLFIIGLLLSTNLYASSDPCAPLAEEVVNSLMVFHYKSVGRFADPSKTKAVEQINSSTPSKNWQGFKSSLYTVNTGYGETINICEFVLKMDKGLILKPNKVEETCVLAEVVSRECYYNPIFM